MFIAFCCWAVWLIAVVVLGLALYGATHTVMLYAEADARVMKAEADKQELLDVLNGKLAMIDTEHGSRYAVVERVTWEVVK